MSGKSAIVTVECGSAEELLRRVDSLILKPEWGVRRRDRWAFRGQRNAAWALIPSAFRAETRLGYASTRFAHDVTGRDLQGKEQGQGEFTAVRQFLILADRVGLRVPGDIALFRGNAEFVNVVGDGAGIGIEEWPPAEVHEALAIAQHHGVPTRLLDFTYSGPVAAWFAAIGASKSSERGASGGSLALWALDLDFMFLGARYDLWSPFTLISVPRAGNDYLRAQEGFFLMCSTRAQDGGPAFEAVLEKLFRHYPEWDQSSAWPGLEPDARAGFKFELPAREAPRLLEILRIEGIDRAHLKPSLDNVVSALEGLVYGDHA